MSKGVLIAIKVVATLVFIPCWLSCSVGMQNGARPSNIAVFLVSIMALITLVGSLYGIWKYKPSSDNESNDITLKKE